MNEQLKLNTIEEALQALREGKPVLVADNEDRENEGDAILAAELASPEWISWIVNNTTGFLCVPMEESRANALDLPLMWRNNRDPHLTNYTITVDATNRISTGVSAEDRANTARVLADPASTPGSLIRPGHMLPLRAKPGGVLERDGHTEAAVDLLKLAGLTPVGVIGEMVRREDGSMMRLPELVEVGNREGLPVVTIEQLKQYILEEQPEVMAGPNHPQNRVVCEAEANVPTSHGELRMRGYYDRATGADHVALIAGNPTGQNVLVRIHSECITGEAFGSLKCECGPQLDFALDAISNDPQGGIVLYLRGQEGRGIGLLNKLKAYSLQEQGMDTVDANLALGFPSENREYGAAVAMLHDLGVTSVRLMTNNPAKAKFLTDAGITITESVPVVVGIGASNSEYLKVKRDRMGHTIPEGTI
ncbi:MAG: GTP cyclohydrolase II [Actinomycetales bacterium]|nr:GTP cyclohydrolase II [Actinomycetales bacterium]